MHGTVLFLFNFNLAIIFLDLGDTDFVFDMYIQNSLVSKFF